MTPGGTVFVRAVSTRALADRVRAPRRCGSWSVAVGVLALAVGLCAPGYANTRSDYLIRLLRSSNQFRVRVQAAVSLGKGPADRKTVRTLSRALHDRHPAVRAAAAAALGRHADPSSLPALERAARDRERAVRRAARTALEKVKRARARSRVARRESRRGRGTASDTARYYVGVGMPGTRVPALGQAALARARSYLTSRLRDIDGVVLAPENESPRAAKSTLKRRSLRGYYIESSVVSLERKGNSSVRAVVSLVVNTYPDRNIKAILQGAATVHGGGDRRQAIEGAYRGALRRLPQTLAAADR